MNVSLGEIPFIMASSSITPISGSFRDPGGRLYVLPNRVLRVVNDAGKENLDCFLSSKALAKLASKGRVISTRVLSDSEAIPALAELGVTPSEGQHPVVVEHERIWFPSFAYEWSPEMLAAAARLTLDMAEALLDEGIGLKDATPYNILFRGTEPVFVDVLSLEPRKLS